MPAKFTVTDENRDDRTATVFSSKGLRVCPAYSYTSLTSASGTGVISSTGGVLHSIAFQSSATAGTYLWLFDSAGTANAIGTTASAVARYDLTGLGHRVDVYDLIFGSGLTYRLSGAEGCDGITVSYLTQS